MRKEYNFTPDNVVMSIGGVDIKPVPESMNFKESPWYTVSIPSGPHIKYRNDFMRIEATDKNGVGVSFYVRNDSEDLKNILKCDPFGENKLEVIKGT